MARIVGRRAFSERPVVAGDRCVDAGPSLRLRSISNAGARALVPRRDGQLVQAAGNDDYCAFNDVTAVPDPGAAAINTIAALLIQIPDVLRAPFKCKQFEE